MQFDRFFILSHYFVFLSLRTVITRSPEQSLTDRLTQEAKALSQLSSPLWYDHSTSEITDSEPDNGIKLTPQEERQHVLMRLRTLRRMYDEAKRTLDLPQGPLRVCKIRLEALEREFEVGFQQELWKGPQLSDQDALFSSYRDGVLIGDFSVIDARSFRALKPKKIKRGEKRPRPTISHTRYPQKYPKIEEVTANSFSPDVPCGDIQDPESITEAYAWIEAGEEIPMTFTETLIDRRGGKWVDNLDPDDYEYFDDEILMSRNRIDHYRR
jgi:hypothetical protein